MSFCGSVVEYPVCVPIDYTKSIPRWEHFSLQGKDNEIRGTFRTFIIYLRGI